MASASGAVRLTQELVRVNSVNPPGNELPLARLLAARLERAGYAVSLHAMGESRANVVARSKASHEGKSLCVTGHLDTVPLGSAPWSMDPFAGEIQDGRIYGRGTSDMKGGVAALVVALEKFAHTAKSENGIVAVFTAGEETGCEGAKQLSLQPEVLGKAAAVLVAEPTSNRVLTGHKGALFIRGTVRGKTAHGSMPHLGINAGYKAARAAIQLEEFGFNVAPHRLLGSPTVNLGTLNAGLNINSVPDLAELGIDVRTIPGQDHAVVIAQLQSYLSDEIGLNVVVDVPSVMTSHGDPWILDICESVKSVTGLSNAVDGAPYFTDAAVLAPAYGGVPVAILGPGAPEMAHQTDEWCSMNALDQAVDVYTEIMNKWLNQPSATSV